MTENQTTIASFAILGLLFWPGFTPAHAAGAFVVLLSFHTKTLTDHLLPKRPDLFKEVTELRESIARIDTLQRDVTALMMKELRK